jgi:hypothetical protein
VRLNEETGKAERAGGIRYTIKDGILYDARQLLADVARMVENKRPSGVSHACRKLSFLPGGRNAVFRFCGISTSVIASSNNEALAAGGSFLDARLHFDSLLLSRLVYILVCIKLASQEKSHENRNWFV